MSSSQELRQIYLIPKVGLRLLTIMLFSRPFAPGRASASRESSELIEINLLPTDIATIAQPRTLIDVSTGLHITSEIVTIFHVDKYQLSRYSDRFAAIFKDPRQATKTTFAFRDVDTQIFSVLVNWLPTALILDHRGKNLSIADLGRLWITAELFEVSTLQNNVVKEICKIMDHGESEVPAVSYVQLWESGVERLRSLAMELLLRRFGMEDVDVIMGLGRGLRDGKERREWEMAVKGKVVEFEAREGVDEADEEGGGAKKIRPWKRLAWFKMYYV